jgi:hypothetical protein
LNSKPKEMGGGVRRRVTYKQKNTYKVIKIKNRKKSKKSKKNNHFQK